MVAMAQALSHGHMMIAWTILLASYFVFAVGRLPGTKIDRPAMAVIGAVLMFVFRVLAPAQAIASIDFAVFSSGCRIYSTGNSARTTRMSICCAFPWKKEREAAKAVLPARTLRRSCYSTYGFQAPLSVSIRTMLALVGGAP